MGKKFSAGQGILPHHPNANQIERIRRVTNKITTYPLVYRWQNIVEIVYKDRVEQFKIERVDKNDRTIPEWEEFYRDNGFRAIRENQIRL